MKKNMIKKPYTKYGAEFKKEALNLAQQIGISAAAKQLDLYESQLYDWRSKAQHQSNKSDVEERLMSENAKLKRLLAERDEENAILKKAAMYFAKSQK